MKSKIKYASLDALIAISSAIVCLYYFIYFALCLLGFDSRLMCLFALFVMAAAGLPVIFRKKLEPILKRAYKPLKIVFAVLLVLYIVSVILFWCYICIDSSNTPESIVAQYSANGDSGDGTMVMVFGCRAYGMRPSLTLRLRLEAALTLLNGLPDAKCIVSGGKGNDEIYAEAIVMQNYLVEHGIAADRIILETNAHSTSENIRFTKAYLDENALESKIIGVSTSFHLPRIEMLSSRYGLPMSVCSSPSPSVGHFYVSMVREYLSYIKMALFDKAVLITKVT